MKHRDIFPAWGRILRGSRPFLSIELTRSCPLHCPGCYASQADHLSGEANEYRDEELIKRVLERVDELRPLHVSLVGGEPLLRLREVCALLPELDRRGIEVQLITNAFRKIPEEFAHRENLHLVVSIDGLQPEHDRRRAPATYARILENIAGQTVIVHCTITAQMARVPSAVRDFTAFWSARTEVRKIWFSLYSPQRAEQSDEALSPAERAAVVADIDAAKSDFPKLHAPGTVLKGFQHPPASPDECIFAQVTTCLAPDLKTAVVPCQLGGNPDCSQCGCIAAAGLAAVGRIRLAGVIPVSSLFSLSRRVGEYVATRREDMSRTRH